MVNISSPNTPGLRDLQHEASLRELLDAVTAAHERLAQEHQCRPPLVLKIAPDLEPADVELICGLLLEYRLDGVAVSNTTLARDGLTGAARDETGGLSGAPLQARADTVLRQVVAGVGGRLAVIGVGGVMTGEGARRKLDLGADLIQLYTGFIYRGPALIGACVDATR